MTGAWWTKWMPRPAGFRPFRPLCPPRPLPARLLDDCIRRRSRAVLLPCDADEPSQTIGVGAQLCRWTVMNDAALVHDDGPSRKVERHAAVLLDQHDR